MGHYPSTGLFELSHWLCCQGQARGFHIQKPWMQITFLKFVTFYVFNLLYVFIFTKVIKLKIKKTLRKYHIIVNKFQRKHLKQYQCYCLAYIYRDYLIIRCRVFNLSWV